MEENNVDDTFCIVKKGSEIFFWSDQLNSVRPSIKFTMESEEDSKLPFWIADRRERE